MRAQPYDDDIHTRARHLYVFDGYTFDEIAEKEGMPSARTIRRWAYNGQWDTQCPLVDAELKIARRICLLADKEDKTEKDYRELDFLVKQQCKLNQSRNTPQAKPAAQPHTEQAQDHSQKKKRKKAPKNDVSGITKDMLDELRENLLYPHQQHWFENQDHRTRFILKPRQIGATFYFSFEAFYDAVVNGRNKIFISASRDQAEIFKANIIALCREHFGVELKGSPLQLNNNGQTVTLYFKSTNARTAQSASGDLYIDEVFWIPKYKELRGLAQAMATHQQYRVTYFSTPSVTSHEAYDHWCGRWFRKTMACNDPDFQVDVTHDNLKEGKLCDDGIWRQMLTVHDVVDSGFDRISTKQLQSEYSEEEFNNLFMGLFIDDAHSAFDINALMECVGDASQWRNYDPFAERPFGMLPVVIGFDPARTIDKATVTVLSCPLNSDDKFRLLKTLDLSGNNFKAMAETIRQLTMQFNVQHIGVDVTGIGAGVFELIQEFFPNTMPIHYNPELKNRLVIKAQQVINSGRFEFDSDSVNVCASFMNIRKKVLGDKITYATNRTASTGHADIAWSIMHAMIYEPLSGDTTSKRTTIGIAA
ncbi:terminase large subunit domain-containing protein [Algicola sagamiensis]|uniref:terminase large subunit domain-containing protein n=1 Tax=Algicola sagamiensis TaxID=163869 RepID=UPI00035FC96C|nr:terminase family protein [Algicola sagamiensis]